MNLEEQKEFLANIKKLNQPRKHKVIKSLGVYDAYKYIRKNKWFNIGQAITEHQFYSIIRGINNQLAINIANGEDIQFPLRMGRLELRKYDTYINIQNKKIKTNRPIDWDRTLKLWYEDKESCKNKTLIKMEEQEIFKVLYNKVRAEYNNKAFYEFTINRDIKKRLKYKIKNKEIDAFKMK